MSTITRSSSTAATSLPLRPRTSTDAKSTQKPSGKVRSDNKRKTKRKAKSKLPRWQRRPLELRIPILQLRCAFSHALRLRADPDGIDLGAFNRVIAAKTASTYKIVQASSSMPIADTDAEAAFKLALRIELVPSTLQAQTLLTPPLVADQQLMPNVPCSRYSRLEYDGQGLAGYLARMCDVLRDENAVPQTHSLSDTKCQRFLQPDKHPLIWNVEYALRYGDAVYGCVITNDKPFPTSPNRLLHCELFSILTLLRRRIDNPYDSGLPEETPHELAPPVVIVTTAENQVEPEKLCMRTIRASFEDCPHPKAGDTEVVLRVEVGEIFDMSDVHRVHQWTDEDCERWASKIRLIMRHVLHPHLGKFTKELKYGLDGHSPSWSESSEGPTCLASEGAGSSGTSEPSSARPSPRK